YYVERSAGVYLYIAHGHRVHQIYLISPGCSAVDGLEHHASGVDEIKWIPETQIEDARGAAKRHRSAAGCGQGIGKWSPRGCRGGEIVSYPETTSGSQEINGVG